VTHIKRFKCDTCGYMAEEQSHFWVVELSRIWQNATYGSFHLCRTCLPIPVKSKSLLLRLKQLVGLEPKDE
jgi:hypothetical protein